MRKDDSNFARFWQAYGEKTSFLREKKWRWVVGVLGLYCFCGVLTQV